MGLEMTGLDCEIDVLVQARVGDKLMVMCRPIRRNDSTGVRAIVLSGVVLDDDGVGRFVDDVKVVKALYARTKSLSGTGSAWKVAFVYANSPTSTTSENVDRVKSSRTDIS